LLPLQAGRNFSSFALAVQHIGRIPFSLAPVSEREDSRANLHHPRVASVLGVARCYHVPLIICRGLSIWPSLIGLSRCAITFVATEGLGCAQVELMLAVIWCCSSAYLSYLFINNLMARWLIYYTPPATMVRLFSISAINAYLTSWALTIVGAGKPRMLLPAWILIALVLAAIHRMTVRKINLSHQVASATSVLCFAGVCSTLALLLELHLCPLTRPE